MIVRVISLKVKSAQIEAFKEASTANHRGSLKEPGVLRFDVLQNDSDPNEFVLYEVYANEAATLAHKETPHYRTWKEAIEPMLAEPRSSSSYSLIAPDAESY